MQLMAEHPLCSRQDNASPARECDVSPFQIRWDRGDLVCHDASGVFVPTRHYRIQRSRVSRSGLGSLGWSECWFGRLLLQACKARPLWKFQGG